MSWPRTSGHADAIGSVTAATVAMLVVSQSPDQPSFWFHHAQKGLLALAPGRPDRAVPRCLQWRQSCFSARRRPSPEVPRSAAYRGQGTCQPDTLQTQRLLLPSTRRKPQGRACTGSKPSSLWAPWVPESSPSSVLPLEGFSSELSLTLGESLKETGMSEEKAKRSPVPLTTARLHC